MRFKRAVSGTLACVMAVTSVVAAGTFSVRAEASAGMDNAAVMAEHELAEHGVAVDYDFSKAADGRAEDKSPCQNNAVVHGQVQYNKDTGAMTLGKNAYVELPNGTVVEGKVQSWKDFDNGDQIQVTIDGKTYLTNSTRVVLVTR